MVAMAASPAGIEGLAREIQALWRSINEMRGAAFVKSSILRGDQMQFQNEDGDTYVILGQFDDGEVNGILVRDFDGNVIMYAIRDLVNNVNDVRFGDLDQQLDNFTVEADDIQFGSSARPASEFSVDAGGGALLWMQPDGDIVMHSKAGETLFLGNGTGTGTVTLYGDPETNIYSKGNVDIDPDGDLRFFIGSTANPANLNQTSNVIRQVSSARKYKANIEDAHVDVADVLKLRPRTWVDKASLERDPSYNVRIPGFIAEELDEHETLRQFVQYNDDGTPESIYYDRLAVGLVAVVQEQQTRLDDFEKRLARLEA